MKHRGNSEFFSIVHDIVIFMLLFLNFEFKFVMRQTNLFLILLLGWPILELASIYLRLFSYVLNI
jgi:hypothetical protein